MVTIKVNIGWANNNYCASVDEQIPGAIVVTDKDFDGIKKAIAEAVAFHVKGMQADGEEMPQWLIDEDYQFEWELETSAVMRKCKKYTSIAAISRATDINEH